MSTEPLTVAQRRELWVHWERLGLGHDRRRADRLEVCARLLGHPVESTTALDGDQADKLLEVLRACRTPADLTAAASGKASPRSAARALPVRAAAGDQQLALDLPDLPRSTVLVSVLAAVWLLGAGLVELRRIAPDIRAVSRRQ